MEESGRVIARVVSNEADERRTIRLPGDAAWVGYVRAAAAGDEGAFASLFKETSALVYSVALRILADPADAEEVTVDVYTQIWRSSKSFNAERGSVMAWLMVLTRSRALDRLRSRGAKGRATEPVPANLEIPDQRPNPEKMSVLEQQRQRIRSALLKLPDEQRQALELAYFSDLSHTELASRLGEPLGTVKTRIRLGMIKLREVLMEMSSMGMTA